MRTLHRWRRRRTRARGSFGSKVGRACASWGITARKAIVAGVLPVIVAAQQSFAGRFAVAPMCEPFAGANVPAATPGLPPVAGEPGAKVILTLVSGMVIASQTVLVTATVCGSPGRLAAPNAVGFKVDIAGSHGRFTITTGWAGDGTLVRP